MKKLKFNSTLEHKSPGYAPYQIEVEKVITLYGREFEKMTDCPINDNPYITEHSDLMYMDGDTAHCLLFLDANGSDGILVEAEGFGYARKSQFIPNARAIIEANALFCNWYRIAESRCRMFISKLRIKNFKQLKDVELNLQERTTILAGPNNSGKTSLIQLLNRVLSEKGFSFRKNDFNIYDLTNWADKVYSRLKEFFETEEDIDDDQFKKVLTDNLIVEGGLSAESICNFSMGIQVDYNDTDDISNFADYIMDLDEEHHSFYFQIQTELDKDSYIKGINENSGKLYDLLKRNENDSSK